MILSPSQLAKLAQDIKNLHTGFAAQVFGPEATGITPEAYTQLVAGGYVTPAQVTDWAMAAYQLGQAQGWSQLKGVYEPPVVPAKKIQAVYKQALADGLPPMTAVQESAVDYARRRGAARIVGLGNRIADDLTTLAIESEGETRKELKTKVVEATAESLIRRETSKKLASRIGNATNDWTRDLNRIAETELEEAHQQGMVDTWQKPLTNGFRLAKRPGPGACKSCKALYLTASGVPKIFTQEEMSGSNFKVKQKDWVPVVGATHPHCHCTLIIVPPGMGFDETGRMVPMKTEGEAA